MAAKVFVVFGPAAARLRSDAIFFLPAQSVIAQDEISRTAHATCCKPSPPGPGPQEHRCPNSSADCAWLPAPSDRPRPQDEPPRHWHALCHRKYCRDGSRLVVGRDSLNTEPFPTVDISSTGMVKESCQTPTIASPSLNPCFDALGFFLLDRTLETLGLALSGRCRGRYPNLHAENARRQPTKNASLVV